jgi:alpha,alpha-trehalase
MTQLRSDVAAAPPPRNRRTQPVWIDPGDVDAVLFDLDGVLTDTAVLHRAAWRLLVERDLGGPALTDEEYAAHVDGRPREQGVRALVADRGLSVDRNRLALLGSIKDRYFLELLARDGPGLIDGTVDLVRRLEGAGVRCAVVTASRNCDQILHRAGIADLFDARVDGVVASALSLPGKPDPATYVEAARRLGAGPARSVVVEDARAGVEAGRRGGFALVIGLDRRGDAEGLMASGADAVVGDLGTVDVRRGT